MSEVRAARFAALGHQESWEQIHAIVSAMRPADCAPVSAEDVRSIVPWIPPRTVSRFSVAQSARSPRVGGVYIDTFISPDELGQRPTRRVLQKIHDGIAAAEREGARLVTLGGFTSILLESDRLASESRLPLTTGNTLTAALIVRGVERAASLLHRDFGGEDVLIIGATGDVGSACARALSGRVRRLLLCARNRQRLEHDWQAMSPREKVEWSTDLKEMLPRATMIIAAASAPGALFKLDHCRPDVIVCDAGYPKNILSCGATGSRRLFWGGMGRVGGGLRSDDGVLEQFYRQPIEDVLHGCMLEGVALALAERYEPFSYGRGHITPDRLNEMWRIAREQGIDLAPLFDHQGLWPEESAAQSAGDARNGAGDAADRLTGEVFAGTLA